MNAILLDQHTHILNEELLSKSLTQVLVNRFNQEGVVYCHWKSKPLEGELDIDLLILSHSLALATKVLMELGFKAATPRWGTNPTGVFHYFGYDFFQGEYVHVHMFTRVLSGESFVKSHLFPFDEMFFDKTYSIDGLQVTSKEAEFVLFILKTFIRYGSFLDARRELRDDKKNREELNDFKNSSDPTKVQDYLLMYCPVVDDNFFQECVIALESKAGYPRKWLLAQKMRWRLRIYKKDNLLGRWLGYVNFIKASILRKLKKQKGKKILTSGGAVIAIVGADATGKSTLVNETSRWLRKNFVVNTIHAGKPPSALLTFPLNFLLVLNRRIKGKSRAALKPKTVSPTSEIGGGVKGKNPNSFMYAIRAVCLAWDRRALLLKVRSASAQGEMIVCDRYPTNVPGMMDSPRLLENTTRKGLTRKIYAWLARLERNIYRQIPPPDIVLCLRVSLEIAKKRNAERETVDDEVYLQERHQQVKDWSVVGARVIKEIDTDPPLDETIATVKQAIWSYL